MSPDRKSPSTDHPATPLWSSATNPRLLLCYLKPVLSNSLPGRHFSRPARGMLPSWRQNRLYVPRQVILSSLLQLEPVSLILPQAPSQNKQWASFKGFHSPMWDLQPSWAIKDLLLSPGVLKIEIICKRKKKVKENTRAGRNQKCWIRAMTLTLSLFKMCPALPCL